MGRALANFRALAELEAQEPKMVEMIQRFEAERSDIILQNVQDSMRFVRLFGDIANLFFPVMIDILLTGGTEEVFIAEQEKKNDFWNDQPIENKDKNQGPSTPDQGGDITKLPPTDGPTQV